VKCVIADARLDSVAAALPMRMNIRPISARSRMPMILEMSIASIIWRAALPLFKNVERLRLRRGPLFHPIGRSPKFGIMAYRLASRVRQSVARLLSGLEFNRARRRYRVVV
jgi:hypothetical protein